MRPTSAARGRTRRAGRAGAWALALVVLAPAALAGAAEPPPAARVIYHNSRAFRIPFNIDPEERARIKEVLLCVSEDRGQSWKPVVSRTTPEKRALAYRAPSDGEFWFAVQTRDVDGRLFPEVTSTIEPKMKVVVDTVPPTIDLAPNGRRGSLASVRWEARDDQALDRSSFVLEFQAVGAGDWRQVPVKLPVTPSGKATWDAGTAGPIRVRASVADRAQNSRDASLLLPDGTPDATPAGRAASASSDPAEPQPVGTFASAEVEALPSMAAASPSRHPRPAPAPAAVPASASNPFDTPTAISDASPADPVASGSRPQLVRSPRFNLQYEVADAGEAGPASVELWVTQNGGRIWTPVGQDPDRRPPFPVSLGGEGVYGLKLVARSASNLGDSPPEPGEPPEHQVEVDSTPPVVKLDGVKVGAGADAGKIAIQWHASDLHLGPRPITIFVRPEGPGGEWRPIATEPVANSGRFAWTVPASAPPRFYVRVQAVDEAGNVGSDETPDGSPILVDRTRPRGKITRIEPIGPANQ